MGLLDQLGFGPTDLRNVEFLISAFEGSHGFEAMVIAASKLTHVATHWPKTSRPVSNQWGQNSRGFAQGAPRMLHG
jgi:hypothetical protein